MKTKIFTCISLILCFSFSLFSQTDADKYWIKEDFSRFTITSSYAKDSYATYPNNKVIETNQANVEVSSHSAAFNIPGGNQMRIRGLYSLTNDHGWIKFTVPNASIVKIYATGKSDVLDRTVLIYRNDELVQRYDLIDRTVCCKFVDNVNSAGEVTYTITAGNPDSTNPIAVYYVEVLKYGEEDPEKEADANTFWIKEDFSHFDVEDSYLAEKNYPSYPNNVNLKATYANIEENADDGCARANIGYGNQIRVRGLSDNGALEFTVPNAGIVRIYLSGKSSLEDRSANIYRNGELVKSYKDLDKNVCRVFVDSVFSQEQVIYKISGGSNISNDPIVVYYIEAEKYYTPPGNEDDYSDYWIHEDFSGFQIETGYSSNYYETFPEEIKVYSSFSNVEWGEGCTVGDNIVRISSREGEEGWLEFTVPDFSEIRIGVTGKSTNKDREVLVYMDGDLVETISELDREVCKEFSLTTPSNKESKIKITGGNNAGSPTALNYIYVKKYSNDSSIDNINAPSVSIYPNPVIDIVYFRSDNGSAVQKAWITDMSGRQVLSAKEIHQMNVSNLPKGIYLIKLQTEEGISAYKLLKK